MTISEEELINKEDMSEESEETRIWNGKCIYLEQRLIFGDANSTEWLFVYLRTITIRRSDSKLSHEINAPSLLGIVVLKCRV